MLQDLYVLSSVRDGDWWRIVLEKRGAEGNGERYIGSCRVATTDGDVQAEMHAMRDALRGVALASGGVR